MSSKRNNPAQRKTTAPSRMFEELIARIESTLVPQGAIVTSPDRIIDKKTGRLREVDASIRYQVGSAPILITVECRKRAKVDDATWIEQLATKKTDIGAAATIAVSWKGFGGPAMTKAAAYGIELRRLEDLTPDEIQKLQTRIRVTCGYVEYKIRAALIQFDPPVTGLQLSEEMRKATSADPILTPFIFVKADSSGLSLGNLLESHEKQHGPIDKDMKPGDTRTTDINVVFQKGIAYCPTVQGNMDIGSLFIKIEAEYKVAIIPPSKASRYHAPGNKVFSHVAEFSPESAGIPRIMQGNQKFEVIISDFPAPASPSARPIPDSDSP